MPSPSTTAQLTPPRPSPTSTPDKPSKGGLTREQRVERARNAVRARWGKVAWSEMPLDEAIASLAELRDEYERAARDVQARMTQPATLTCNTCKKEIPNMHQVCQTIVYRDKQDNLIKTIYFCSALCISKFNKIRYGREDLPR